MNYRSILLIFGAGILFTGCKKAAPPAGQTGGGRPAMQVVAMEAARVPVAEQLALVGSILANEIVRIRAEIEGKIEEIGFSEGQKVTKGQLLFQLDASKLTNELAEAEANFKLTESTFNRNKELSEGRLISPQEFDQSASRYHASKALLELRARLLKDSRILAPFDGIVGARNVSPGQVVDRNTALTWLVDSDPVKIELNVPERYFSDIKIGQSIELGVSTYPGRKFKGDVFFVSPAVDPDTRTILVKAKVPNPDGHLKPGMFVNLELTLRIRPSAVVIPEVALARVLEDDRAQIFIVDSNNTAQIRLIRLGTRLPGRVEVVEGLSGGENVIVEGVQKVGPGAPVSLAPASESKVYRAEIEPVTNKTATPP